MMGEEFRFVYSSDLWNTNVTLKICTLEGILHGFNYERLLENPALQFSGRNQRKQPDLMVKVVVHSSGRDLHIPIRSRYKPFGLRWEWNESVRLPVKYADLPRDTELHLTVYDAQGAGSGPVKTISLW